MCWLQVFAEEKGVSEDLLLELLQKHCMITLKWALRSSHSWDCYNYYHACENVILSYDLLGDNTDPKSQWRS